MSYPQRYRLGIDLDDIPMYRVYQYYFNLKNAFPDKEIVVYRTKHGWHIILPDVMTSLRAREIFGDDLWRIRFEEARSEVFDRQPEDILFSKKRILKDGRELSSFTRFEKDLMKEPWINPRV